MAVDKLPVFVSIAPQKFFVQQIGKDLVDVQILVAPGADPHSYEPKPQQMAALSKATIYFAVGVPFEKVWLEKIAATNPQMTVVHTDRGIQKLAMEAHHHDAHAMEEHEEHHHTQENAEHHQEGDHHHENGDHHEHAGLDPHIWLSPPLVRTQARAIAAALKTIDPAHRDVYDANLRQFVAQIDRLDSELRQTLGGQSGMQFMVFHPAWGYFADAYGLEEVPIEIEGKNPKPAQLKALIQHARDRDIRVVFVQPQFSTKSASVVAREIGGQVVFADPLAEDWMANLREVAAKFKAALR
jgi:zinc transport system substrate-binding protein